MIRNNQPEIHTHTHTYIPKTKRCLTKDKPTSKKLNKITVQKAEQPRVKPLNRFLKRKIIPRKTKRYKNNVSLTKCHCVRVSAHVCLCARAMPFATKCLYTKQNSVLFTCSLWFLLKQ